MFSPGADDINARRIDAAVTEDVGEFGDVLFNAVEYAGEQVSQVVRKHLVRIDVCFFTKRFHISPNVRPADRFAAACDEDTT